MFFKYFSRQIKFSRTFQDSPVKSSTFKACANPELSVSLQSGLGPPVPAPLDPPMCLNRYRITRREFQKKHARILIYLVAYWDIFHNFFVVIILIFFKINFFNTFFQEYHVSVNQSGPRDQTLLKVVPDLGPNYLQRLSAEDTSRYGKVFKSIIIFGVFLFFKRVG